MDSSSKIDRKTIERNRRIQMKNLCSRLVSLIPDHHFTIPKNVLAQQEQLEQAGRYIVILRERVEELRRKRETCYSTEIEVREYGGSEVEVVITSGVHTKLMLHQLIRILEEEGAQVVTVAVSTIATQIFHTIHAQIKVPRVGVDSSRISKRIHDLII